MDLAKSRCFWSRCTTEGTLCARKALCHLPLELVKRLTGKGKSSGGV